MASAASTVGGAASSSNAWTVEGPEGEDIASPIFGVNKKPTIPLADTLAAARVRFFQRELYPTPRIIPLVDWTGKRIIGHDV